MSLLKILEDEKLSALSKAALTLFSCYIVRKLKAEYGIKMKNTYGSTFWNNVSPSKNVLLGQAHMFCTCTIRTFFSLVCAVR